MNRTIFLKDGWAEQPGLDRGVEPPMGGALMFLESGEWVVGLGRCAVAEQGIKGVAAASGEGDHGLVVELVLCDCRCSLKVARWRSARPRANSSGRRKIDWSAGW